MADALENYDEFASDDEDSALSHPSSISDEAWLPGREAFEQIAQAFEKVVKEFIQSPSASPDPGSDDGVGDWGDLLDDDGSDDEFAGNLMDAFGDIEAMIASSDGDSESSADSLGALKAKLCDQYDATHVWRHLGNRFKEDEDICKLVIEQYIEIYKTIADGTLAKEMEKTGLMSLVDGQNFFWSQLEIIHLLKNVAAVAMRWDVEDDTEERWADYRELEVEVARALASSYLYKDIQRQTMQLRQQLIRTRKAATKRPEAFLKCSGAKGRAQYRNGLPRTNPNKKIKLVFASEKQRTEALGIVRQKLGKRRQEIDVLNQYRAYNKNETEKLFDNWTEIRKDMQIIK